MTRSPALAAASTLLTLALIGCSAAPDPGAATTPPPGPTTDSDASDASGGHGAVAGASEAAEAQLHLVTVDAAGAVGLLDLLSGDESSLGTITAPDRVESDGRYVFAAHEAGLEIIDSGAWTWDHGDHFHYYRGTPRLVGSVPGSGPARVVGGPLATAGGTGVFFPGSGEAVLLDNAALAAGTPDELFRVSGTPHAGLLAPLGAGAIITEADDSGRITQLRALAADGTPSETTAPCPDASSALTTRSGTVFACADGAVLGTVDADEQAVLERIPLSETSGAEAGAEAGAGADAGAAGFGTAPTELAGRKGRPTVAGISAASGSGASPGFWRLDTRARSWHWTPSAVPLLHAIAVDDAEDHVVVLDAAGSVRVFRGDTEIGATDPLLSAAELAPEARDRITLSVDAQRAYLGAADSGVVAEIDFADGARIARELRPAVAPVHLAETGR